MTTQNIPISQLPVAVGLSGEEYVPVVQGGVTKRAEVSLIRGASVINGYTVSTLPSPQIGLIAYVTDALSPTYLGTLTGGGTVVTPVFYNGVAWITF